MFEFVDRLGNREKLNADFNERVEDVLLRHNIPPASVIVLQNEESVSDSHQIDPTKNYEAALIEGYDIRSIREIYNQFSKNTKNPSVAYQKRRLTFLPTGDLQPEQADLTLKETADHVEQTLIDTCREFGLIEKGDKLLIGLSGGVDSSSLAVALSQAKANLPPFQLVAVTFEDYDSSNSPTYTHASNLARQLDIDHHIAPATLAEEVFHLNKPLRKIFPELMKTSYAHQVMYADHHTTRRTLEVFAKQNGFNKIALGLHTTDLVAGLLNGWMTGYNIADIPLRKIGDSTYVYPLAFITKRELHLYHFYRTGQLVRHSNVNAWERNPLDRNFYYYIADQLQSLWPGLEMILFSAHNLRIRGSTPIRYEYCTNCGAALVHQPFTVIESAECDVCSIFRKAGYIKESAKL